MSNLSRENRARLSLNKRLTESFADSSDGDQIKKPSILADLENLLTQAEENPPELPLQPVVRLKSMSPYTNPTGKRIIMIRRDRFSNASEYETALPTASFPSLMQWYKAGILDQYPAHARRFAEQNILSFVHEQNKRVFQTYAARGRYEEAYAQYHDQAVNEYKPGDYEYEHARWTLTKAESELDEVNPVDNFNRFAKFTHALEEGIVQDPGVVKMVVLAMLLALCDSLPQRSLSALPAGARGMLRRAVIAETTELEDRSLIENLSRIEKGNWTDEGIREGIRQVALRLLNLG